MCTYIVVYVEEDGPKERMIHGIMYLCVRMHFCVRMYNVYVCIYVRGGGWSQREVDKCKYVRVYI